ncbi:hypothetical protein GCM10027449_21590 [Sinomonas notoginsengisoli]|uniref:hypothetical protein n=1 Tax=Sinomonas notoginsengisoli TaxID=1457311 RepID=UPI001F1BF99A|nr:hypothetical protein [Sinomonas notoginsengisoli]
MTATRGERRSRASAPGQPARVRAHWAILAALLIALALALAVQGYAEHLGGIGNDSVPSAGSTDGVPASVTKGGPVVDARTPEVRTARPANDTRRDLR